MLLDSGICTIYRLCEGESAGLTQAYCLKEKSSHYFKELTVGYGRHYEARRNNESVDRSLRIWRDDRITALDICEVGGQRYCIRQVQPREDEDGLLVTDLALELASERGILEAEVNRLGTGQCG